MSPYTHCKPLTGLNLDGTAGDHRPSPNLARHSGNSSCRSSERIVDAHQTSVLSSALVALVYVFALQLTRQRSVAALTGALCAASPTFVGFGAVLGSEHLATPLALASLILALEFRRLESPSLGPYALVLCAGLCLGSAILTRGEAVFYVPVVLAAVSVSPRRQVLRGAVAGTLCLVGVGTLVVPWYQRNAAVDQRAGLSTTSGLNFYLAHNETGYGRAAEKRDVFSGLSEVERNEEGWRLGWRHIRETHVVGMLRSTAQGTLQLFLEPPLYAVKWSTTTRGKSKKQAKWNARLAYRALGYAVATAFYYALLLCSLFVGRHRRKLFRPAFTAALALVFTNWLCYAVIFWGKARYRYLVEVLMCVFAAVTLDAILRARASKHRATQNGPKG